MSRPNRGTGRRRTKSSTRPNFGASRACRSTRTKSSTPTKTPSNRSTSSPLLSPSATGCSGLLSARVEAAVQRGAAEVVPTAVDADLDVVASELVMARPETREFVGTGDAATVRLFQVLAVHVRHEP